VEKAIEMCKTRSRIVDKNINSRQGRGFVNKQMPLDIPNVPKNILKAHEEQVYKKTTPMILITEPFLI
jgi:hypothetical protein